MLMQEKHNEDASWNDIDWGQMEPEPVATAKPTVHQAVAPPPPAKAAPVAVESSPATPEQPRVRQEHRVEAAAAPPPPKIPDLFRQKKPGPETDAAPVVAKPAPTAPEPLRAQPAPSPITPPKAYIFAPSSVGALTLSNPDGKDDLVITVNDQFTVGRHKSNDLVIKDSVRLQSSRDVCLP